MLGFGLGIDLMNEEESLRYILVQCLSDLKVAAPNTLAWR
jgi:hypothetical protein